MYKQARKAELHAAAVSKPEGARRARAANSHAGFHRTTAEVLKTRVEREKIDMSAS